jgi:hypothetical protein
MFAAGCCLRFVLHRFYYCFVALVVFKADTIIMRRFAASNGIVQ